MTRSNILRNVVAIVICLAAMTFNAQVQLGGTVKCSRQRRKERSETGRQSSRSEYLNDHNQCRK